MPVMSGSHIYNRVVDTLVGYGKVYERGQLLCEVVYKSLVEQEVGRPPSNPSQEVEVGYKYTGDVMQCRLPIGQELELELEGGRRIKVRAITESKFEGEEANYQP